MLLTEKTVVKIRFHSNVVFQTKRSKLIDTSENEHKNVHNQVVHSFDFCSQDFPMPEELKIQILRYVNHGKCVRTAASVSKVWKSDIKKTFVPVLHVDGHDEVKLVSDVTHLPRPRRMDLLRSEMNLKYGLFDKLVLTNAQSQVGLEVSWILGRCAHHVHDVYMHFPFITRNDQLFDDDTDWKIVCQVEAPTLFPSVTFMNLVKLEISGLEVEKQATGYRFPELQELKLRDFTMNTRDYSVLNDIFEKAPKLVWLFLTTEASSLILHSETLKYTLITRGGCDTPFRNQFLQLQAPKLEILMLGDVGEVSLIAMEQLKGLIEEDPFGPMSISWDNNENTPPPQCRIETTTWLESEYDLLHTAI